MTNAQTAVKYLSAVKLSDGKYTYWDEALRKTFVVTHKGVVKLGRRLNRTRGDKCPHCIFGRWFNSLEPKDLESRG